MKNIDHKIEEAAKSLFGHTNLFKHQRQACEAILSKQNVLLVAPMGSGKSLCYQLPTFLSAKPTLVVSPLIALMDAKAVAALRTGDADKTAAVMRTNFGKSQTNSQMLPASILNSSEVSVI